MVLIAYFALIIFGSYMLASYTGRHGAMLMLKAKSRVEMVSIIVCTVLVYVVCMQGWGQGWAIILGLSK